LIRNGAENIELDFFWEEVGSRRDLRRGNPRGYPGLNDQMTVNHRGLTLQIRHFCGNTLQSDQPTYIQTGNVDSMRNPEG